MQKEKMAINNKKINSDTNLHFTAKGNSLFAAGIIDVIVGFLLSLSPHVIDATLIFSLSLTVAILIIIFSAKEISELLNFPLLILSAATLHIALIIGYSKLMMMRGNIGIISNIMLRNNGTLPIIISGLFLTAIFVATFRTFRQIKKHTFEIVSNILPLKQISIETDIETGIINKSQAVDLQNKVALETGFFAAISNINNFVIFCAIIEFSAVIINILISMAIATTVRLSAEPSAIKTYTSFAISLAFIMQTSTLITIAVIAYLVRKNTTPVILENSEDSQDETIERISIVSTQLPNEDKADKDKFIKCLNTQLNDSIISNSPSNTSHNKTIIGQKNCLEENWQKSNGAYYYDSIASLIEEKTADVTKTVLMVSENIEELPVTIPVNIAVRIAKKGLKCLLIDMDSARNAIAKVFDVDINSPAAKTQNAVVPSGINNLSLLMANNTNEDCCEIITRIKGQYNCVFIYAPNVELATSDCWEQIANCIDTTMFFGANSKSNDSSLENLRGILKNHNCKTLKPTKTFAGCNV
ncbi:MAG: FHIPEP family type III secretion protein [Planctomycetes bacterium]|nr:FHIPEP family type III secretion protein [Planctomycetota bacterium]